MLLLADDFFFVAHDSISMKSRLSDRVLRLGLAGALLGEQVLFQRITVRGNRLRIVNETPPRDALAHTVLDHLRAEPDITAVRDWLRFLGQDAHEKVVQRLLREGHMHLPQQPKSWIGRRHATGMNKLAGHRSEHDENCYVGPPRGEPPGLRCGVHERRHGQVVAEARERVLWIRRASTRALFAPIVLSLATKVHPRCNEAVPESIRGQAEPVQRCARIRHCGLVA